MTIQIIINRTRDHIIIFIVFHDHFHRIALVKWFYWFFIAWSGFSVGFSDNDSKKNRNEYLERLRRLVKQHEVFEEMWVYNGYFEPNLWKDLNMKKVWAIFDFSEWIYVFYDFIWWKMSFEERFHGFSLCGILTWEEILEDTPDWAW